MILKRNSVRAKLREKGFLLGSFVEIAAPEVIEILGTAGMDFAVIDREHAAFSGETTAALIRAAASTEIAPIVRVRENRAGEILEALDLGAVGLHVPQIATREQAERAVRAVRFPPAGERGFNPFVRAGSFGAGPVDDQDTLLVLHIEAAAAVSSADEILSVPGIDVAFLGPYDLSMTLGIPGQVTDEPVRRAMRAIGEAARRRGVTLGVYAHTIEHARVWLNEGVCYLAVGVDSTLLARTAGEICRQVNQIRERS
ncbi:MAG: aldolase [Acidobacteria bacterium]|nr:aldolase [Acidobacteriota bacterium]